MMPVTVTNGANASSGRGAAASWWKNKRGGVGGGRSSFAHRGSSSSMSSTRSRPRPRPRGGRGRTMHRRHYYTAGAAVAVYLCAYLVVLRELGLLRGGAEHGHGGGDVDDPHRGRGGVAFVPPVPPTERLITGGAVGVVTAGTEFDVDGLGLGEGTAPRHETKPKSRREGVIEDAEGTGTKSVRNSFSKIPAPRGGGDELRGPTGRGEWPFDAARGGGRHGDDEEGAGGGEDHVANSDFPKAFDVFPRPYRTNCTTVHKSYLDDLLLAGITFRSSGPARGGDNEEGRARGERELRGLFEDSIRPDIFLHSASAAPTSTSARTVAELSIFVDGYSPTLEGAHEGYVLQFPPPVDVDVDHPGSSTEDVANTAAHVVKILARTQVGVIRAFETLTQLIQFDFDSERCVLPADCVIRDVPRFRHRGLLIDVARHYLPPTQLRRIVDQLRMNKLSVLHLHLTDDESFPFATGLLPEVSRLGANSGVERYTKSDLRGLVEYARVNGVRVIAELDQPGHIGSLYRSHPELFACDAAAVGNDLKLVALDPTNPGVYDFMVNLTLDVMDVFRDTYFHLGTDEIPVKCWENLTMEHDVDADEMFKWYVGNMTDRLASAAWVDSSGRNATTGTARRRMISWDEAFVAGAVANGGKGGGGNDGRGVTAIQVWRSPQLIRLAIIRGYEVIASPSLGGKSWYLDNDEQTWWDAYQFDPEDRIPPEYGHQLLGGEGCMWGEKVDISNIENRVWPRMSAIGEKLWSERRYTMQWRKRGDQERAPPMGSFYKEVSERMGAFRCHLVKRGVHAGPPSGGLVKIGDRCGAAVPSIPRAPPVPDRNPWSNWNGVSDITSSQSSLNQTNSLLVNRFLWRF